MNMKKQANKLPYIKPKIERVRLVSENAILSHCQGFGPNGSGHNGSGCPTLNCKSPGS